MIMETSELNLGTYEAVSKFKSVRRAQRRGLVTPFGTVAPKRPFNNRSRTLGRKFQSKKENIYEQIKQRGL